MFAVLRVPSQDYFFTSYRSFRDVINTMTEIPEVAAQLPEWWIALHLYD